MCLNILYACVLVCVCTYVRVMHHVPAWCLQRSKEGNRDLELELRMAVNHHVDTGNRTQVLSARPASALNQ